MGEINFKLNNGTEKKKNLWAPSLFSFKVFFSIETFCYSALFGRIIATVKFVKMHLAK